MSVNKKALTRYLVYDKLFRNRGRKYIWKDLLEAANEALQEEGLDGIGKTQLYADIHYMQCSEWKAPIETETDPSDKRIKYYSYSDPGYSISNQPLSDTEMTYLKSAVSVLTRFKGMPQFEWINEIIPAIESKLGLVKTEKEIISFESNVDYEGLNFITPLFNAIINKRVFRIIYQDFKSLVPYEIVYHPYYLKQYNNRWFIFGYNPQRPDKIQNLALDRIKHLQESSEEYLSSSIDWEDYFSDFVGVSKNDTSPIEIRLLIMDNEQASYIRTKPLHQTQKPLRKVENGFETSIKVIPNYELEKLILSFGERIKVISPTEFQKKIAERMRKSALLYTENLLY
jgi:predicted DNA-binding transcriptional regulator YafY